MPRFHGTAARQLVLIEKVQPSASLRPGGPPRIRLLQKDMYAELTRRRRRAQIAARRWVQESRLPGES